MDFLTQALGFLNTLLDLINTIDIFFDLLALFGLGI